MKDLSLHWCQSWQEQQEEKDCKWPMKRENKMNKKQQENDSQ